MAKHGLHRLLRHPAPLLCSDSRRRLYTKAVDKAALGRGDTGVATQAFSQDPRAGALQMIASWRVRAKQPEYARVAAVLARLALKWGLALRFV